MVHFYKLTLGLGLVNEIMIKIVDLELFHHFLIFHLFIRVKFI